MENSEQNVKKLVMELWGSHCEILGEATVARLVRGQTVEPLREEQPKGGSPLNLSASIEIVTQGAILVKTVLEIAKLLREQLGRKASTKQIRDALVNQSSVQSMPSSVSKRLDALCDLIAK